MRRFTLAYTDGLAVLRTPRNYTWFHKFSEHIDTQTYIDYVLRRLQHDDIDSEFGRFHVITNGKEALITTPYHLVLFTSNRCTMQPTGPNTPSCTQGQIGEALGMLQLINKGLI